MNRRPGADEHDPFYSTYVDQVPDGEILEILRGGIEETLALLDSCPPNRESHRYAPGKWSLREVVGHVGDAERLYAYRALHFARADPVALPAMDPATWAAGSNAAERPLTTLARELGAVRAATLALFESFDPATWNREGVASGRRFTVRALAWIVAGHEIHHRRGLAERYLAADAALRGAER